MTDCAVIHTFTHLVLEKDTFTAITTGQVFRGILIDTGAARGNTSSLEQYMAYSYHVGCRTCINRSKAAMCHFGNGSEQFQWTASTSFPLGAITITFDANILVDANVPLLICIDEIDSWGLYFNNITNRFIHTPSGQYISVARDAAHPFIKWNPVLQCYYTTSELRQLHHRFGHPHTDKLMNLLRKAKLDEVTETTRHTLENIGRSCKLC